MSVLYMVIWLILKEIEVSNSKTSSETKVVRVVCMGNGAGSVIAHGPSGGGCGPNPNEPDSIDYAPIVDLLFSYVRRCYMLTM